MTLDNAYHSAAEAISNARALVITAGAGMGVDSGLPDFRGDTGFWNAYPMYERLGINFVGAANPEHFQRDPAFGWGFYGHRTNLYRATVPHEGFRILLKWAKRYNLDYFVVTSNVDGQFQKAGFSEERIVEVHGSIHHLQCLAPCSMNIWENDGDIRVDTEIMRARSIPKCRYCGGVARPNILMFGDWSWISCRTACQEARFDTFLEEQGGRRMVIVEMGAGTAIPTIRYTTERLSVRPEAVAIRMNPREPRIDAPHISIPCGALEGLKCIERRLVARR